MFDSLDDKVVVTGEEVDRVIGTTKMAPDEILTSKREILSVLVRVADEPDFMSRLSDDVPEALKGYYTLTQEQKMAFTGSNIQKIDGWLGKLDGWLASWLWCRLC